MDVEGFLRDLFGRLHVTEMSCALIYFSLVEYFSFVFEKLPILPRIPLFLFSVTSTLTALSFMTFWFALQRFVKTVLTFGFGLDDALVSIILQPSFALIVAVWSVDVALDGFSLFPPPSSLFPLPSLPSSLSSLFPLFPLPSSYDSQVRGRCPRRFLSPHRLSSPRLAPLPLLQFPPPFRRFHPHKTPQNTFIPHKMYIQIG